MQENNKKYGFNIVAPEFMRTVPSLGSTIKAYMKDRNMSEIPETLQLMWDKEKDDYNGFHFWSNFEIGSLKWFRSEQYEDFFQYLDQTGNFFYERWGDAPAHSVAAGLFLSASEIHYFEDIGYRHADRTACPRVREEPGKYGPCACDVKKLRTWGWGMWAYSDHWGKELDRWNQWVATLHRDDS